MRSPCVIRVCSYLTTVLESHPRPARRRGGEVGQGAPSAAALLRSVTPRCPASCAELLLFAPQLHPLACNFLQALVQPECPTECGTHTTHQAFIMLWFSLHALAVPT